MSKSWNQPWVLILLAWALSLLAAAFMVPQLYVNGTMDHLCRHDPETGYQAVYALINQWTNGGFASFDRFDHLNYAYSHLTTGFYTVSNVLVALLYLLISPFLSHPAEQFYWIYVFGFNGLNMLLRTVGGFLILKRLGLHPAIIGTALIILNTMLSVTLHFGLLTNNLYSYLPLLMYFIWTFIAERRMGYFLGTLVIFTIAVADSPLFGLGYFYEVVHFFIISCLLYQILTSGWQVWPQALQKFCVHWPKHRRKVLIVGAVCFLILLPSLWMFNILHTDFFVANSGLQGTQGRLNNAFHPLNYFKNPQLKDVAYIEKFLFESVDYFEGLWEGHWPWLGAGVLALAFLGLMLSRVRAKWIFAMTIGLVLLSNTPVSKHLPLGLAHYWINALTNPFSFLLRTFHMPTLLAPFLYLPLVGLGLQSLWDLARNVQGLTYKRRLVFTILVLLGGTIFISYHLFYYIKVYVLAVCITLLGFLYAMLKIEKTSVRVAAFVLAVLVVVGIDLCAGRAYAHRYLAEDYLLTPRLRPDLDDQQPMLIEYQNPLYLPFRQYMRTEPLAGEQIIHSYQSNYGIYYKYPAFDRYFLEPSIYRPLPKVYKDIYSDRLYDGSNLVQRYLAVDRREIFLASSAICPKEDLRGEIFRKGLSRQVVTIEGNCDQLPSVIQELPKEKGTPPKEMRIPKQWRLPLAQARRIRKNSFVEYRINLPDDFPKFMATGLFTRDKELLSVELAGKQLRPVQGKIIAPFEFDINNVHQGQAAIALPSEMEPESAVLTAYLSTEIRNIWKNTHDQLGLTYTAMQDGWLVMHWPYGPNKWSLKIDGQKVPIYRANKYFLATPIAAGDHDIELSYWPGSALRFLIPLSLILTIIALFAAVGWALKREK